MRFSCVFDAGVKWASRWKYGFMLPMAVDYGMADVSRLPHDQNASYRQWRTFSAFAPILICHARQR